MPSLPNQLAWDSGSHTGLDSADNANHPVQALLHHKWEIRC